MAKWVPPTEREKEQIKTSNARMTEDQEAQDEERRKAVRLALRANVTSQSQDNFFSGLTENVSEGGMFVSTLSPPPVGESVSLRVSVNSGEEVIVKGIVRWLRSGDDGGFTGCGVQFTELSAAGEDAISQLMKSSGREPLFHDV